MVNPASFVPAALKRVMRSRHSVSPYHPTQASGADVAAATRFYGDVLNGRRVWQTGIAEGRRRLWFIVGRQVVAVRLDGDSQYPLAIEVGDSRAVAERCWDAGYTVLVGEQDEAESLSVLDPFGRRVILAEADWHG